MPKVNISFNLPDEQIEYNITQRAGKMHSLIWEFTNFLRLKTRYGDPKEKCDWNEVSDAWWQHLKDEGIDPYEE